MQDKEHRYSLQDDSLQDKKAYRYNLQDNGLQESKIQLQEHEMLFVNLDDI